MKQSRWKKIEAIFYEVVALSEDERESFVKEKCGNDEELCREILTLLWEDAENPDFLNEPVFNEGLRLLENDLSGLLEQDSFSHYKLQKLLGRGGMGVVFLARDELLERDVALKVLPIGFADNPESVLRFRQEARAASAISHPNIAHIYEFGEFDGNFFLAMEFVEGRTLRELIKENSIDVLSTIDIVRQIAEALAVMHRRGIVHRDIKPENVIINENNLVRILDFGLAKLNSVSEDGKLISLETTPGMIIGTTAYMSPEQVRGQRLDGRSDLWSLGILLFEMLALERPFTGETSSDVQAAILLKDVPLVKLPIEFVIAVGKLLKKDLDERYQTAEEFLSDLQMIKQDYQSTQDVAENGLQKIDLSDQIGLTTKQNRKSFLNNFSNRKISYAFGIMIFLLTIIGFRYWFVENIPSNSTGTLQIESIAVMPFVNESGSPDNDLLSDGLTSSLIKRLSLLPNLTVKARNSVFHYKGKTLDPKIVGRELSVQTILLGSVNESGGEMTFNLELFDVLSGDRIWSRQYNRKSDRFYHIAK